MGRDLAQRAQKSVQRQGEGESFNSQLAKMEAQFQRAMPKGGEAVQLIRDVMTCVSRTPKLAEAARTPGGSLSIIGSAMTCAQLGLRPGVGALGHAWILPFWDNKSREQRAQLIIGYKGYIDLGQRSDRIGSLHSRTVYANDQFDIKYGLGQDEFEHTPYFMLGHDEPGEARLFYAVGRLANGGTALADPMTLKQMQDHRDKFAMAKNREGEVVGPWRDHFESMARKTMLLRLMALMPKSTEIQRAMENDGSVRMDLSPGAIDTPDHIDGEVIGEPVDEVVNEQAERETVVVNSPAEPVPDVQMASRDQLDRLAVIQKAEKYTDADWFAFLAEAAGVKAKRAADLTFEEAARAIAVFDGPDA